MVVPGVELLVEAVLLALHDDALGGGHARLAVHHVLARAPQRLVVARARSRLDARAFRRRRLRLVRRRTPRHAAVLQVARRAGRRARRRVGAAAAELHRAQRTCGGGGGRCRQLLLAFEHLKRK